MASKKLISPKEIDVILRRLACQLVENHGNFNDTVLIALQPRGIPLINRLVRILAEDYGLKQLHVGKLDTTFYRDDFRRRQSPIEANSTQIDFLIEGKRVVFVDDVLYTGRSIRAALDAVLSFGRPKEIELMVLIDRRFSRELPIQADYIGRQVDSIASEKVRVEWSEGDKSNEVLIVEAEGNE